MNNTATIRALTTIVVVVVFIFTSGSLAAATSSSPTPQPQNLICAHTINNATCTKEGIISTTATQIPLPMPRQLQPPAALAITRHVIEDIVATISAKDFSIGASGTNVSPQSSFQGAQSPGTATTAVTSKPGTFPVALLQQANATATTAVAADHNKCGGGGDIITCAYIQETHYPAKDTTTPFVLPIPFP
jgi:hypothetical protein